MKKTKPITTLFLDIGGVLLTNGWDHEARKRAAKRFKLDYAGLESRHHLNFDTYEQGKMTFKDYLDRMVFNQPRTFTRAAFRQFMFDQSTPYAEMLALFPRLKQRYGLKIFVVSNEARELNDYRIKTFKLARFVDAFVSSCFVKLRKPDIDIFKLALDMAQTPPEQVVYVENTFLFADLAETLGVHAIRHKNYQDTRKQLAAFGLKDTD